MKLLQPHPDYMHRAEPTAEARSIEVFANIIRRDRGSDGDHDGRFKQKACKELAWIYHMADFESPYFKIPEEQRRYQLADAIFGDPDWEPDELVQEGLELYQRVSRTPSMKLLDAAYESVEKLEKYFRDVEFDTEVKGKLKYSPKDLIGNIEKLGKLVDGLSELRKQVQKEQQKDSQNWGGVELNEFNRGEEVV